MSTKERGDMLKTVLDAMPSLIFVVDEDLRVQEYNAAAASFALADQEKILKRRTGEVLHCLNSDETPEGCGHAPACTNCIVRNSVTKAFHGTCVVRNRTRMEIIQEENRREIYALITTSPFRYKERDFVLLVVEDISEVAELHRIIPICAVCRKIRDDEESWHRVETYFKTHWDVDFSHSLCPECFKIEMAKI